MSERDEEPPRDDQSQQAKAMTDKNLHVHPDEATGEIDPSEEHRTRQTPHGLTQKDDEETR